MSRTYPTFRQQRPFSDGWKEATYSSMAPSDHVHSPLIIDAEGRQMPISRYGSGPNGETYVIKAEIVEHSIVPASDFVTSHRSPLALEEKFRDNGGENRHPRLGSNYHYPEKFEELPTDVANEACRGPTTQAAVPVTRAWHSGPNWMENSRKYGDERDLNRDDYKKLNDSPYRDRQHEPYLNSKGTNTHPMIGSNRDVFEFYKRPRGNEAHNAGNRLLSKPTNDINTATVILTAKDDPPFICRNVLKIENNRGGEKPFENKDGYEIPKRHPAAVQFGQTAGHKRNPQTIDSKEASMKYGKLLPREMKKEDYEGTITSKEAMEKYKGVLVPP